MKVLVIGGTGRVGREVVASLYARGVTPRALVRYPGRAARVIPGAWLIQGDLRRRASIEAALEGIDAVFFMTPHDVEEERLGLNVIEACEAAGVKRLVYSSSYHLDSRSPTVRRVMHRVLSWAYPQYKAKLRVEERVRSSAIESVVLMPSDFYQNDELHRVDIVEGRYPLPLGSRGVDRVDCRDVGRAGARALLGELEPGAYPIVGARTWTGDACAQVWSAALGRRVRYAGDNIDAWARRVDGRLPVASIGDRRRTYGVLQRFGADADARACRRSREAVGRSPIAYERYVSMTARRWLARRAPYLHAADSSGTWG